MAVKIRIPGQQLKGLRQYVQFTQAQIAEAFNTSQSEVSLLENGRRKFLYADSTSITLLDKNAAAWLRLRAVEQLRREVQETATFSAKEHNRYRQFFGMLPCSFVRKNLGVITDAIAAQFREQIAIPSENAIQG